jgi:signal transduction histidine kinase
MNGSGPIWWSQQRRKTSLAQEPEAALFQGLRIRLTLWYSGVLGIALVLFGMVLYLAVQNLLFAPVEADAYVHASKRVTQWLTLSSTCACSSFISPCRFGFPPPQRQLVFYIVACFDQNGSLLPDENTVQLPPAFLTNTVVKEALQVGSAHDIVNGGSMVGPIYRYALAARSSTGNMGVVLIGEPIQGQESVLSLLLQLFLTIGGVTLFGAGLGGLLLANGALAPAHLAWTRQQRFIADASHELRTPLTLLRADAEVLLRNREHLAAEDAALLEDIVAEANHMATLATNMLTLARLDNHSSHHQEHEVLNLADVALTGARRVQALADQMGITIEVQPASTTWVIGDPTLLEQAVLTLLDNAIKYNRPNGRVTLRVAVKDAHALLEVCDTGIGIAAEHLAHLGERFYRVDKARSREAGGTGLGLSIARSIAHAHGGTLTLTSVPEQGTTATLMLPVVQASERNE